MSTNSGNRRLQRCGTGLSFAAGALVLGAPVMAQQQGGLEEIVVTARFREENLQQTPLAITAFSGENLEARNLTDEHYAATTDVMGRFNPFSPAAYLPGDGRSVFCGVEYKF